MGRNTQIVAADFLVVPTATYRLVFVLVLLAHERRPVVHLAVTSHRTAEWTRQQLREGFTWAHAPRYLLHDRDHAFAAWRDTATSMGTEEVLTAPRTPWQSQCRLVMDGSWRSLRSAACIIATNGERPDSRPFCQRRLDLAYG